MGKYHEAVLETPRAHLAKTVRAHEKSDERVGDRRERPARRADLGSSRLGVTSCNMTFGRRRHAAAARPLRIEFRRLSTTSPRGGNARGKEHRGAFLATPARVVGRFGRHYHAYCSDGRCYAHTTSEHLAPYVERFSQVRVVQPEEKLTDRLQAAS